MQWFRKLFKGKSSDDLVNRPSDGSKTKSKENETAQEKKQNTIWDGLIEFAKNEEKRIATDSLKLPIFKEVSSLKTGTIESIKESEKIWIALFTFLASWYVKFLFEKDPSFISRESNDLTIPALSYAICQIMQSALLLELIHEGTISEDVAFRKGKENITDLVVGCLVLYSADQKVKVVENGNALVSQILNSEHPQATEIAQNISSMTIACIMNSLEKRVPHETFDKIFLGLFDAIYKAIRIIK